MRPRQPRQPTLLPVRRLPGRLPRLLPFERLPLGGPAYWLRLAGALALGGLGLGPRGRWWWLRLAGALAVRRQAFAWLALRGLGLCGLTRVPAVGGLAGLLGVRRAAVRGLALAGWVAALR
jgi:hypothetical protein